MPKPARSALIVYDSPDRTRSRYRPLVFVTELSDVPVSVTVALSNPQE